MNDTHDTPTPAALVGLTETQARQADQCIAEAAAAGGRLAAGPGGQAMNENALLVWRYQEGPVRAARVRVLRHALLSFGGLDVGLSKAATIAEGDKAAALAEEALRELLGLDTLDDAASPVGVTTIHEARCACGRRGRIPQTAQVFHALRERGWRVTGGAIVCPWCVAKEDKP